MQSRVRAHTNTLLEIDHSTALTVQSKCNVHEYKTLVLWAWQACPGIVHVPERARSEFTKSQLQLLSLSVLVQTLNLFYQCSGVFDLMGVE